ncbi:putative choline transporter, neither null mutation nor overexpression affects choline transport [Phlyctochytrium bullatum]|nr:putative choline transporter, neither null mutation nor overexpression affects choline transport [Phlyctochytrium bullatum]
MAYANHPSSSVPSHDDIYRQPPPNSYGYSQPPHQNQYGYATAQQPQYYQQQPQQYPPQPQFQQQQYYQQGPPGPSQYGGGDPEAKFYYNLPPPNPPKMEARPKFHDLWATILFILVNLAFIGAVVIGVPQTLSDIRNTTDTSSATKGTTIDPTNGVRRNANATDFTLTGKDIGGVIGAAVGVGVGWASVYFVLMMLIAGPLIHITYWLSLLVMAGLTAYYAYLRLWVAVVVWGIFTVLFAINYFLIRNRIPFARVMLTTVTRVVAQFNGTIFAGFIGLILSCVYSVLWIASVVGLFTVLKNRGFSSGGTYGVLIVLLLIFYWTNEVIRNTIHVTVSGTFATVYFTGVSVPGSKRVEVPESMITLRAAGRALGPSFGPICFGSLLVAIVATLRAIANQAKQEAAENGNIFLCLLATCISCLLACIQDLLEYFNKYAYTQVAIYGKSYCDAAKSTWRLIQTRGLEAVINDSLIGNVLFIGSLMGGLVCAFVGYLYVRGSENIPDTVVNYVVVCVVSGLIGMWLFLVLAEVITSGVATTYVCIAEDPATLARQQPELFAKLYATWPDIQWGMQSTVY